LPWKSIEAWWKQVGQERYPNARELFITADAGGSNGYRSHVWNQQLRRLADTLVASGVNLIQLRRLHRRPLTHPVARGAHRRAPHRQRLLRLPVRDTPSAG
jgi:hypothetical protein